MLAAITPSCPDRSIVNAVVYDDAAALAAALDGLAETYERAGVRAWTVWVPEADRGPQPGSPTPATCSMAARGR